jgi:dipeptidyl aminopeptidase/acylaminoacyl peptidase
MSLVDSRKSFQTKLIKQNTPPEPVAPPPAEVFSVVKYDAPAGKLAAYLSPDPGDGKKHPAIIWITGGDCNTIGDVWTPADPKNDQTAAAFREVGMIMMFPSLRGGNDNPGVREGLLGEVDDVIAAADYLAAQPYVDSGRIYLGGHSTGGTLVMLVAESTDKFRAVFSFGPVNDVRGYSPEYKPFDTSSHFEIRLRSPEYWLRWVKTPTYVIEGTEGNIQALRAMKQASTNERIHFLEVSGKDHFAVLAPVTRVLAAKVLADDGPEANIQLTEAELAGSGSR